MFLSGKEGGEETHFSQLYLHRSTDVAASAAAS